MRMKTKIESISVGLRIRLGLMGGWPSRTSPLIRSQAIISFPIARETRETREGKEEVFLQNSRN
jgi:hypothetical protein